MFNKSLSVAVLCGYFGVAQASFLPANQLHLQDDFNFQPSMSQVEFNEIIKSIVDAYKPLAAAYGANLTVESLWGDSTVNASANQDGIDWSISMYGGLARRPEVTKDGFAMVVCHELGHHFGGYAFYEDDWAASEGQSDYFAMQSCAKKIWKNQTLTNATFRSQISAFPKAKCDAAWKTTATQDLCYRTAVAGQSLGNLLSQLDDNSFPKYETPDKTVVSQTVTSHPNSQCRLDTYINGATCTVKFLESLIPGRNHPKGQQSISAELIAAKYSCTQSQGFKFGNRPTCWFKPLIKKI